MSKEPDIKLFNRDCMEAMAEMPDKAFDLAIVDPQYGIDVATGVAYRGNGPHRTWRGRGTRMKVDDKKDWDKAPPSQVYFDELFRVSRNQIIWGANHFVSKVAIDSSCWIVWDKKVTDNCADCELAWTSFTTAVRKFEWLWNGYKKQKPEERIHRTQKPVALYRWLLDNYASVGDKILDTHGGSRSLAIACYDLGFDHVSYEIDPDYHRDSVERFERHKSQPKLFTPEEIRPASVQLKIIE